MYTYVYVHELTHKHTHKTKTYIHMELRGLGMLSCITCIPFGRQYVAGSAEAE
jgi:hypothetical protein